jgi:fused signal recognition particle receptor
VFDKLRGAINNAVIKTTTKELTDKNLSDAVWELQLVLIQNDVAVEVAEHICELTKKKMLGSRTGRLENLTKLFRSALHDSVIEVLTPEYPLDLLEFAKKRRDEGDTTTILFVGVNGTGKTTTLAKLAHLYKKNGFSVVIAAGDTFRAGSSAGRMQSNKNLIEEMKKMARVAEPDLKIFVGDALAGNDALSQAKKFNDAIGIDGAILTKVDADPSGGAALSVAFVTGRPVVYVGIGQGYEDLQRFNPEWLAQRLMSEK